MYLRENEHARSDGRVVRCLQLAGKVWNAEKGRQERLPRAEEAGLQQEWESDIPRIVAGLAVTRLFPGLTRVLPRDGISVNLGRLFEGAAPSVARPRQSP
jgi:hypothetical protein